MVKKKEEVLVGSLITGAGLGGLISLLIRLILTNTFSVNITTTIQITITLFLVGLFIFFAYKKPATIEAYGFVLAVFVFLAFIWDNTSPGDVTPLRILIAINAVILFILNYFTGVSRKDGAKRIARGAVGLWY